MSQPVPRSRLTIAVTCTLIYGIAAGLVGGLWCVAGAGMYGSPLALVNGNELLLYVGFLIVGPALSLLGGLVSLSHPRIASRILLLGGCLSACLSMMVITTDAHVIPLLIITVPMLLLGAWLQWASSPQAAPATPLTTTLPNSLSRQQTLSILVSASAFVISFIGTFALTAYLTMENVLGFRTQPVNFMIDNARWPDTYLVLTLLGVSLLLIPVVQLLRLRWSLLIGMWMSLGLSLLIVWIR
jgi:hypothetical protein